MVKVLPSATIPVLLNTLERFTGTELPVVPDAITAKLRVAVWISPPEIPKTVMKYVPAAVAAPVAIVSKDDPAVLIEAGTKLAVEPAGTPVVERVTIPAKPLRDATVAVNTPPLPAVTELDAGLTARPKSTGLTTERFTFAAC